MGLSSICLFTMFILLVFPFFFFNFTIANFTASSMLPLCHDDERSALLQFKESRISGDFYAWKFDCRPTMASWKPEEGSVDCCSWDDVHCNKNTGHVIKLDLSHSCLFGSIDSSSSLFKLVHLEWLNLALNDFNSSEIPPEIINLSSKGRMMTYNKIPDILAGIILSNNSFDGAIPASIENLKGLQVLNLQNNNLQGHIPSCLGNLTNLESLDLSNNKFSGRIPQQLVQLTFLAFFNVSDNYLTGLIPQGKQFATFDNTSLDSNSGFCGRPLSKECESGEPPTIEDYTESSEESLFSGASDWKIILIGYAGGLVAGLVLGFNFNTGIIGWILEKLGTQQKATRRRRRRRN